VSRKKSRILTDHELRLMDVLWQRDAVTVADVVAALPPPPLAYSTVLTTLRTLEQKGYVAHKADGRAFVYHAVVARDDAAKSAMDHLVHRFFGNSPGDLAVALLDDSRLSEGDVAKIQRLLHRRKGTK
jgi:BlaI family transcriptional regulator, penicillinase repressor